MEHGCARLTVYFEGPFWVGVLEREEAGRLEACKVTFGAEPKDRQVYEWLLREWRGLTFSPGIPTQDRQRARSSPKRRQRAAADELSRTGVGTKAQQALQLQREQSKLQRQERCRERDAAEQERKFRLRREKRREKRRGQFFRSLSWLNDFGMDTNFE